MGRSVIGGVGPTGGVAISSTELENIIVEASDPNIVRIILPVESTFPRSKCHAEI